MSKRPRSPKPGHEGGADPDAARAEGAHGGGVDPKRPRVPVARPRTGRPILRDDDVTVRGLAPRVTGCVPLPPDCGELEVVTRVMQGPPDAALETWLEATGDSKSFVTLDSTPLATSGGETRSLIRVPPAPGRSIRLRFESRGNPAAVFRLATCVSSWD